MLSEYYLRNSTCSVVMGALQQIIIERTSQISYVIISKSTVNLQLDGQDFFVVCARESFDIRFGIQPERPQVSVEVSLAR